MKLIKVILIQVFICISYILYGSLLDKADNELFKAIEIKNIRRVKLALKKGADINAKNEKGNTPLQVAFELRYNSYENFFYKKTKQKGYEKFLKKAEDNESDFNTEKIFNIGNELINEFLESNNEYEDIITFLIQNGADINIKDEDGYTPLMYISQFCKLEIIKLLLEKGAEVNAVLDDGFTVLMVACESFGRYDVVKLLIENGAKINAKNDDGYTALMFSCMYNRLEIVKLLIEKGADLKLKDNNGNTVLILAAQYCQEDVVKILLSNKIDIKIKNKQGKTALDYAKQEKCSEIEKMFIFLE